VSVLRRLYKLLGGRNWRRNTFLTAVLFPGTVFAIFWTLNITMWWEVRIMMMLNLTLKLKLKLKSELKLKS
jgi:Endomembrane protein 70